MPYKVRFPNCERDIIVMDDLTQESVAYIYSEHGIIEKISESNL